MPCMLLCSQNNENSNGIMRDSGSAGAGSIRIGGRRTPATAIAAVLPRRPAVQRARRAAAEVRGHRR